MKENKIPEIPLEFARLYNLTLGFMYTAIAYAAAKLGIADLLGNGGKSVEYLAEATGSHPGALYRLLWTLASVGILRETTDRTFQLTPMGELLQENHPLSLRPQFLLFWDPVFREPWGNIIHSIKTGENACEHTFKKGFFDYLNEQEDTREIFSSMMTIYSNLNCPVIAASYPFSKFRKVIDIGGGHGALLAHILRQHPTVNGVLFDLPDVVKGATEIDSDLSSRCEIIGGDFFQAVPEGGDIYILQEILHDWNDELAIKILVNCRKAMADDARLLVVENMLIYVDSLLDYNKVTDLHMLLTTGGRQRTEAEFRRLFQGAGLELTRTIPTNSAFTYSIIEGKKR